MSIATDQEVKNLRKEVESLKARVLILENPPEDYHPSYAETASDLLRQAYEKTFGKKPHHLMKESTIKQALDSVKI